MSDLFLWLIMTLNIISMVIIYFNFYSGNETSAIFQAITSIWVLLLVIFGELVARRR